MVTRFAVLPDERGILLGIDKNDVFEKGVVYQAIKWDEEIILKPMGKYVLATRGTFPNEMSDNQAIISSGMHLITQEEYDKMYPPISFIIVKRREGQALTKSEIASIQTHITNDVEGGHYITTKEIYDLFPNEIKEIEVRDGLEVWYDDLKP